MILAGVTEYPIDGVDKTGEKSSDMVFTMRRPVLVRNTDGSAALYYALQDWWLS